MPRLELVLRKPEEDKGQVRFYTDRQGRVRHAHDRSWLDPYGRTLYQRVNSRWVKFAYWCPSCKVGALVEEEETR